MLKPSSSIPSATLGYMKDGEIATVRTDKLFADGIYVLVGLPGVFTPICTKDHIPSLIAHADAIRASGVRDIFVISDDNPWALDVWSRLFDGKEKIRFFSDGNRELLNQTKMISGESDYFLNGHYARFYAIIENGIIRRVRSEVTVLNTVCTNGDCILSDIADIVDQVRKRANA